MLDAQTFKLNTEFSLERFDNEILLYSPTDTRAIYLSETAFLVYGMCSSGKSVGDIIACLEEAYPDQKQTIREDVAAAIDQLLDNGALLVNE